MSKIMPNHQTLTKSVGHFEVTKTRIHDDLLQESLLKKDKKAASFVTIGELDIALHRDGVTVTVEILGLDIYDPISGSGQTAQPARFSVLAAG